MRFTEKDPIIKDIRQLELRDEVTTAALRMMDEIDTPVVFWLNANVDKNYAGIADCNPYQFWIPIRAGTSKAERERLVLAGLYMGIQRRRRVLVAKPTDAYKRRAQNDEVKVRRARELIGTINSFAASLETELFIDSLGLGVTLDEEIKKSNFQVCGKELTQYLEAQKYRPGFSWNTDEAARKLIEFSTCSRYSPEYSMWFKRTVQGIRPIAVGKRYYNILCEMENIIQKARRDYNTSDDEVIVNKMKRDVIACLGKEKYIKLEASDADRSEITVDGNKTYIFAFVPEGSDDEDLAIRGMRAANECMGLLYEAHLRYGGIPPVRLFISYLSKTQTSVNAQDTGGYTIVIFMDYLRAIDRSVLNRANSEDLRATLFKYAIFYTILHEYGHIINGDCDDVGAETAEERCKKERAADAVADRDFHGISMYQYRQICIPEIDFHWEENKRLFEIAKQIANDVRECQ